MLEVDAQQRHWHPLLRTGSGPHSRKPSGATQPSPPPQVTKVPTRGSICHYFQGTWPCRGWDMEGLLLPIGCSAILQIVPGLLQSPASREISLLLLTALVRCLLKTTKEGLVLRPRVQRFRKQRVSEKNHIKIHQTRSTLGTSRLKNPTSLVMVRRPGSLHVTGKLGGEKKKKKAIWGPLVLLTEVQYDPTPTAVHWT